MAPNYREKNPRDSFLGLEQPRLPRARNQNGALGFANRRGTNNKEGSIGFRMYLLPFFVVCLLLVPYFYRVRETFTRTTLEARNLTKGEIPNPNNTTKTPIQNTKRTNFANLPKPTTQPQNTNNKNFTNPLKPSTQPPFTCPPNSNTTTQTCPKNPPSIYTSIKVEDDASSSTQIEACPDYFRWIHEDLKPWKENGISKEALEAGIVNASFRLLVLQGRVYVEAYQMCYATRDVFTIWGIFQLLRVYPGKVPDLDMIFSCGDLPVIQKAQYGGNADQGGLSLAPLIPPMFHYCGDDASFDIAFPDWSFWGWVETNIKPWEDLLKDLKEGNERVNWVDRVPYAFWKGNLHMGWRSTLRRCNSSRDWNAQIFSQSWRRENRAGFRQSALANQCTHRYKIYIEGIAWSVSEKYIQACDSMLLLVLPRYYEFFTRSLMPLKHYWPIHPRHLCKYIKFAVDWGNNNTNKAQDIGKEGSRFIMEDLKMKNVYDYMFHLLNQYARLLKYKPTIPPGAVEVCLESMVCNSMGREKQWKMDSMVKSPSQTGPCTMPQPYEPSQLQEFLNLKNDAIRKVDKWVANGDIANVDFS